MYTQDSFFTLSAFGQFGLTVVSLILAAFTLLIAVRVHGHWLLRLLGAGVLAWGFVWLSPQVYYSYYRMIIANLPAQWVIGTPPVPRQIAELMMFAGPANLSAHSQGLLIWGVFLAALVKKSHLRRNAAN
ncbi:MAG: hypothetical protein ABJL99_25270 [Aliishimia sp.]